MDLVKCDVFNENNVSYRQVDKPTIAPMVFEVFVFNNTNTDEEVFSIRVSEELQAQMLTHLLRKANGINLNTVPKLLDALKTA